MFNTILDAIGNTPLVRLKLSDDGPSTVYAKLELYNPFGMKDRVGLQVVLDARREGKLVDKQRIVESSSGTMALGIALAGTYLGHPVHIITDPRTDQMTLSKLHALGCTVEVVTEMGPEGWQSARLGRLAEILLDDPDAFCPYQYDNRSNPDAYVSLAQELIRSVGQIDIIVGSVGSGGSLCGTARALKELQPETRVVAVDAVGSVIFDQPDIPDRLQGGHGNSVVPRNVSREVIDEVHWMSDAECFSSTIKLVEREKIFAGNSSGCVYKVMEWLQKSSPEARAIVGIFPDRGDRYYKTLYDPAYRISKGLASAQCRSEPELVSYGTPVSRWSYASMMRP